MIQEPHNMTKEERFWDWLVQNSERLYLFDNDEEEIFEEVLNQLHKVDKNLTFEISPALSNGVREFIVSADGVIETFASVIRLVERAPKIKKWKVIAFRQRIVGDDLMVEFGDDRLITYDDVFFRFAPDSNKIGLELHIRNYDETMEMDNALFILLDSLIGEYDMETEISWLDRVLLDESELKDLYALLRLRDIIDENKRLHQN